MVTGVHVCTTNQHSVRFELGFELPVSNVLSYACLLLLSHAQYYQITHSDVHNIMCHTPTHLQTILLQNMYQNPNNQTQNPGVQPGEITEDVLS